MQAKCETPAMADVKIDLPPRLLQFAQSQVEAGDYADVADYIRSIIREDKEARDRLVAEIQKGIDSPDGERSVEEIWQRGVEKAQSRAA